MSEEKLIKIAKKINDDELSYLVRTYFEMNRVVRLQSFIKDTERSKKLEITYKDI